MTEPIRLARALLPLTLGACIYSTDASSVYDGTAASQSIALAGLNTEPGGYAYPQILTSLNVGAKDSSATWLSLAALPIGTTPVMSGGEEYFPFAGSVGNFTDAHWPPGGVARMRVLVPQGSTYGNAITVDDANCLTANSHLDFEDRAALCVSHDSGYLHFVDTDPVSPSDLDYISLRETPPIVFQGNVAFDPADDYYDAIDPDSERTTLEDWQTVNGFDGTGRSLPGYDDVVSAVFYNRGDLELGRDMNCVRRTNTDVIACYVTNYGDPNAPGGPGPGDARNPSLDAAIAKTAAGLVATVAMEYRPAATSNRVTFYAFNDIGDRVNAVELDSEGAKNMPGVCLSCHGGLLEGDTVDGAHFLPFDLDALAFRGGTGPYSRMGQQDEIRALNAIVADAGPTPAIAELIDGWYGGNLGTLGPPQNTSFVPAGWTTQRVVYLEVVKPYCRTCHVALEEAPRYITDFNAFGDMSARAAAVADRVCDVHDMPHAEVTRMNFWNSPARGHLIGELNLSTACD